MSDLLLSKQIEDARLDGDRDMEHAWKTCTDADEPIILAFNAIRLEVRALTAAIILCDRRKS